MTRFALTSERRDELVSLLGDGPSFRAMYPAVADYLKVASGLSGTGSDAVDQDFDVRLLHFMTGGESDNPYWDVVEPLVARGAPERGGRWEVCGGSATGSGRLAYAQMVLQSAYAYAVPSPETLAWVVEVCEGRPLLEIGAGRGYWAHLLAQRGVDVLAFDSAPPGNAVNVSFLPDSGPRAAWHPVGGLEDLAIARAQEEERHRVLFLCWPPGWGEAMAADALRQYHAAGGDRVIFIGEPEGGKTGTAEFFSLLATQWEMRSQDRGFVSWWNLDDLAQVWTRRG